MGNINHRSTDKIIIIGNGETALLAYEYFTYDSIYEVSAFCCEEEYISEKTICGLPVISFEEIDKVYSPLEYKAFVAISSSSLNRVRSSFFQRTKAKGYNFVSYVSSKAFVWRNVEIGENCFILENNVIQSGVKIGDNVTLWSGNHIGHRSIIKNNVFVASHVVVSGFCEINENCFIGVNTSVVDYKIIARDCVIGAGSIVAKNTEEGKIYRSNPAKASKIDSFTFYNIKE